MRYYETIFVLAPEVSQEDRETLVGKLRGIIQKNSGSFVKEEDWGKRKLAYQIEHKDYGYYTYFLYNALEATVHKLEAEMNIQPDILRYISVRIDDITPYLPKQEAAAEATDGVVQ